MIVVTSIVSWFHASAITVWPFVFIAPGYVDDEATLKHEQTHLAQQKRWAVYGLGVGLLVWFVLYLLCLPVWYNPWRRKWETEAYRAGQGYDDATISQILKQPPYYLKG